MVPNIILLMLYCKQKKRCLKIIRKQRVIIYLSMIFLDLYIFIQHFLHVRLFDSYDSHTLVNSNFLLIWTLKNVAVFIIIYYTFRKVSKKYMNKELWLNLLKFFFSISIVVIILFGLLLLFRPN